MPELAEVEYFRKQWSLGLNNDIEKVWVHPHSRIFRDSPATHFTQLLTPSRFTQSFAHGKQMLFQFNDNIWMGLHLGMTGKLTTASPEIVPGKSEHLVLIQKSIALVFSDYRMFGKVTIEKSDGFPQWWNDLPPLITSSGFTQKRMNSFLNRHPRSPIKANLLNQSIFPGIGNWMADEILWRARIHPACPSIRLTELDRSALFKQTKKVCKQALDIIGTDWGTPPDSWLFNHRWKDGGICPVTKSPLLRETIAGRTTCYSPMLQKLPND